MGSWTVGWVGRAPEKATRGGGPGLAQLETSEPTIFLVFFFVGEGQLNTLHSFVTRAFLTVLVMC